MCRKEGRLENFCMANSDLAIFFYKILQRNYHLIFIKFIFNYTFIFDILNLKLYLAK